MRPAGERHDTRPRARRVPPIAVTLVVALLSLVLVVGLAWSFVRVFAPEALATSKPPATNYESRVMTEVVKPEAVAVEYEKLLAMGSRYLGQPGREQADAYIEAAFEAAGLELHEQPIRTLAPRTAFRGIHRAGPPSAEHPHGEPLGDVEVYPFMPNHLQPVVTPTEGLEGELVLLDAKTLATRSNFDDVIGVIDASPGGVSADFAYQWPRYAQLGVKALVVSHREGLGAVDWHTLLWNRSNLVSSVPVNFVRVAASEGIFAHLGERVRLRVRVDFVEHPNRTLFGVLRAPRPAAEAIVVYAPYDATAVLPDLAPGAMAALNTAYVLGLVKGLAAAKQTLQRDVIFMATPRGARLHRDLRDDRRESRGRAARRDVRRAHRDRRTARADPAALLGLERDRGNRRRADRRDALHQPAVREGGRADARGPRRRRAGGDAALELLALEALRAVAWHRSREGPPTAAAIPLRPRRLSASSQPCDLEEGAPLSRDMGLLLALALLAAPPASAQKSPNSELHHAVWSGDLSAAREALAAGANPSLCPLGREGVSVLQHASLDGALDLVSLLCAAGADLDDASGRGWTALHMAAAQGHADVVEVLLAAGADGAALDERGCSPAHLAIENRAIEGFERLAASTDAQGRSVLEVPDASGLYAAHKAALFLDEELALPFADLDLATQRDAAGRTPLLYAAMARDTRGLDLWTSLGLSLDDTDACGSSARTILDRTAYASARELDLQSLPHHEADRAPLLFVRYDAGYSLRPSFLLLALWPDGTSLCEHEDGRISVLTLGPHLACFEKALRAAALWDLPSQVRVGMHEASTNILWFGESPARSYSFSESVYPPEDPMQARELAACWAVVMLYVHEIRGLHQAPFEPSGLKTFRGYDFENPWRTKWRPAK